MMLVKSPTSAEIKIWNYAISSIFTITAIIQLIKILTHKDAAEKKEHLGEDDPTPTGEPLPESTP